MAYTVNQSVIDKAKQDWNDAYKRGDKTAMEQAHATAEAERAKAGYSGGKDGSQYISTNKASTGSEKKSTGTKYNTTIYSPTGNAVSGYILNGQTYLNDGTRIGDGYSVVDSTGKIWTMQNGSGVQTGNVKQNTNNASALQQYYESLLSQQDTGYQKKLSQIQAQQEAAAEAQAEAQRAQIAANKKEINSSYDNSARQAYITSMQNQRALPEMMSTQGMTGGATESSMLGLQTNYENNIADLEAARNKALADADLGLNDVNANLASTLADINSQYALKQLEYEKEAQDTAKSDYITTINQYYDDYQAEINRLLASGVPETDYRIQYLRAARQQKIADQKEKEEQAALEAAKLAAKYSYSSGSSSKSDDSGTDSDADVFGFGTKSAGTTGKSDSKVTSEYNGAGAILLQRELDSLAKVGTYSLPMIQEKISQALKNGTITTDRARALLERYGI